MEKLNSISNGLIDWIIKTLNSGVKPELIVDAMVRKGYDARLAYTTLFRMVGNGSVHTVEGEQISYSYETPEIAEKGNMIHTHDHDIKVRMKIEKPFIMYMENVLSDKECDELIRISKNRLKPSEVYDPKTGERKLSTGRTSKGTYYQLNENELITKIERRIAELTNYPMEHGEGLQILNYQVGEEYKRHFDYFPSNNIDHNNGGQRVCTVLLYLNDVKAGGETTFPKIDLSITPKKGTAIYFHYGNSKGQVDRLSLHSSIPVIHGEKWVATKWIREKKIVER